MKNILEKHLMKGLDIHKDYQEKSRQLVNYWQTRALTAEGIAEKIIRKKQYAKGSVVDQILTAYLDGWWVEVVVETQVFGVCMEEIILIPLAQAIEEKRGGRLVWKEEV